MRIGAVRSGCKAAFAALVLALVCATGTSNVLAAGSATTFQLSNGMLVCVVEDHRAPVVTHMVWYRVGGADDPWGSSGLAHFLEHMMFKGTRSMKSGEFTKTVTGLGGRHNALTTHDTTSYFQRVAKEHLRRVMELEADRMQGLVLTPDESLTERNVVREERRGSVDGSPIAALNEQMLAQLFLNHPYGRPVLGWAHEIMSLTRDKAAAHYKHYYAPNNAILVVVGDVTPDEVRTLAEATYGRNAPGPTLAPRIRPSEPDAIAARKVEIEDSRAGAPFVLRLYLTPGPLAATTGEDATLAVLARILGGDDTSRLYRHLVVDERVAVHAGADFQASTRDSGRVALLALAAGKATAEDLQRSLDRVVADFAADGVTDEELVRAKRALEAEHVFETDDQEKRGRRYGRALTYRQSLADIEGYLKRTAAVTAADVAKAARTYLTARNSVTGTLVRPSEAKDR